jgi:TldD protein
MDLKNVLDRLDLKKFQCHFVDVRIERSFSSYVRFQNGDLVGTGEKPVMGAFIRVHENGTWFYASTTKILEIEKEIEKLLQQARTTKGQGEGYILPPNNGVHHLINKAEKAFSKISLEKKVKTLEHYLSLLPKIENVKESLIMYTDVYKEKFYKNSSGTEFSYDFNQAGFLFDATLGKGDELFSDDFRTYFSDFEDFKKLDDDILSYFKESQRFLGAPTITPGKYKVVLSPEITGVFTHESFGHKSEADFMMGDPEATKEWKLGSIIGSPCLSIVDTGVYDNTSGYCPIDDEGTLAKRNYLIKEGILTGRLHSTHTANVLDEAPTGNARAMNFEFEPIVRMTSTFIEAGKTPFKDLLKMAEGGVYFENFKHGSGGSTFTIAPIRSYQIKDGELHPVRVSVLSGSVFETLNMIEACGDDFELVSSAFGGCGKMEQAPLPVSDGGPSILVREMQVS